MSQVQELTKQIDTLHERSRELEDKATSATEEELPGIGAAISGLATKILGLDRQKAQAQAEEQRQKEQELSRRQARDREALVQTLQARREAILAKYAQWEAAILEHEQSVIELWTDYFVLQAEIKAHADESSIAKVDSPIVLKTADRIRAMQTGLSVLRWYPARRRNLPS